MQTRYLYASVTATGQTYFDMPNNSTIRGCLFACSAATGAAAASLELELSLASTNQTAVTDALNVIAIASFDHTAAGSPASISAVCNSFYAPCDQPIKAGERVYLNYTEAGGDTWKVRCLVWFT